MNESGFPAARTGRQDIGKPKRFLEKPAAGNEEIGPPEAFAAVQGSPS